VRAGRRGAAAAPVLDEVGIGELGGRVVPIEILPGFVQAVAPILPTYHLAQLAHAQMEAGPWLSHALALLATTAIAAVLAALSVRKMRV
jgi:ABC-2 type transport system permease protein